MSAANEEEGSIANQRSSKHLRCSSSEKDLDQTLKSLDTVEIIVKDLVQGETDSVEEITVAIERPKSRRLCNFNGDLTYLEIPKGINCLEVYKMTIWFLGKVLMIIQWTLQWKTVIEHPRKHLLHSYRWLMMIMRKIAHWSGIKFCEGSTPKRRQIHINWGNNCLANGQQCWNYC
ncbi:hypothetical protein SLA2020_093500 [Shorea laevis]